MPNFNNPLEVLALLEMQNSEVTTCIQEITLRVVQYHPVVQWQCVARFRDANLPPGVFVDEAPEIAFCMALGMALRGPGVAAAESRALFHDKRPMAQGILDLMMDEYPNLVASGKVEFAPYKGWVVVLFPKSGADLSFLGNRVEVRSLDFNETKPAPAQPARTTCGAQAAQIAAGRTPAPAGSRMAGTKDVLDNEYKAKMGKFPDRNIKKADLAKLLDEMEAAGK